MITEQSTGTVVPFGQLVGFLFVESITTVLLIACRNEQSLSFSGTILMLIPMDDNMRIARDVYMKVVLEATFFLFHLIVYSGKRNKRSEKRSFTKCIKQIVDIGNIINPVFETETKRKVFG